MLARLADTARAFDWAANEYDGTVANNALIQRMRAQVLAQIAQSFPPGARLLDLGCGTGIDAVDLAKRGYRIVAIDSSPGMVQHTRARIAGEGLDERIRAMRLGIHELDQLQAEPFDGVYSNFGPLNCVPDLRRASREIARLLKPRGRMIASVIGKLCPWEIALYALRGDWQRARFRLASELVAIPFCDQVIWTRYYSPREFYRTFEEDFEWIVLRALNLFMPPPYLIHAYERHRGLFSGMAFLDDHLGSVPLLRNLGDHFLIVLQKRDR
jgi:ubiquinone/menaquinone biosynthesis C-methylase UbiE